MAQIDYYLIFRWMREDLHLDGTELHCYAIIYSLSKGDNWYNAGVQNIMDVLGKSKPTIISALGSLTEKELVVKVPVVVNNAKRYYYKAAKTFDEDTLKILKEAGLNNLTEGRLNGLTEGRLNNLTPIYNKGNNKEINKKRLSNDNQKESDNLFEVFWETYGNKKSKEPAMNAWKRLTKEEKEKAIKRIPEYKEDCRLHERQMKYPATYLNQKTWEDDFDSDGMVSNEGSSVDLPEGLTQKEWEKANYWMIVTIPRISGRITADIHMQMVKMTHSKVDVYVDILKEIEDSDYDDDLLPEFTRLCQTKYKERIEV